MTLRTLVPALSLALLVVGCGSSSTSPEAASASNGAGTQAGAKDGALTIAVIPKGTTHSYWKAVHAGAEQAGQEFNATIRWKGPLKEDDRAGQIGIVQGFTADNVSGIVLAPLDDTALATPVRAAEGKRIPVVIIDSPLKGEAGKDFASLVATDNRRAGELGAERLAKAMGERGNVVLLRYAVGSASTNDREEGFLTKIRTYPGIKVISDDAYGGATQSEAQTKAMQMTDTLRRAQGVFTPNESSTLGMARALAQSGLTGKIRFVGFDATPELIAELKSGAIDGLVAQNPTKMGYLGVKAVVDKIRGKTVEARIDTGVMVIDRENLESSEVVKLLAGK